MPPGVWCRPPAITRRSRRWRRPAWITCAPVSHCFRCACRRAASDPPRAGARRFDAVFRGGAPATEHLVAIYCRARNLPLRTIPVEVRHGLFLAGFITSDTLTGSPSGAVERSRLRPHGLLNHIYPPGPPVATGGPDTNTMAATPACIFYRPYSVSRPDAVHPHRSAGNLCVPVRILSVHRFGRLPAARRGALGGASRGSLAIKARFSLCARCTMEGVRRGVHPPLWCTPVRCGPAFLPFTSTGACAYTLSSR